MARLSDVVWGEGEKKRSTYNSGYTLSFSAISKCCSLYLLRVSAYLNGEQVKLEDRLYSMWIG